MHIKECVTQSRSTSLIYTIYYFSIAQWLTLVDTAYLACATDHPVIYVSTGPVENQPNDLVFDLFDCPTEILNYDAR